MRERVWDEGYEVGYDDAIFDQRGLSTDSDADQYPHENPYRGLESADIDLAALRAAAEGATPGPWKCAEQTHGEWYGIQSESFALGNVFLAKDGAHVAAANPAVVLALLDRLAVAEAAVARVRAVAEAGDVRTLDDSEEPCVMLDDLRAAIDNEEKP